MSLENNSKYDLIGVQFTYGVKKDATEVFDNISKSETIDKIIKYKIDIE